MSLNDFADIEAHDGFKKIKEAVNATFGMYDQGILRLAGSRYFDKRQAFLTGAELDTRDWDFYAQYSDDLFNRLVEFKVFAFATETDDVSDNAKDMRYPFDDQAKAIFVIDHPDFAEINIVLRKDAALYAKVQERITVDYYREFLWKSGENKPTRKQIQSFYNQAYKLAA